MRNSFPNGEGWTATAIRRNCVRVHATTSPTLRISGIKSFKPMADFDWSWPTKIERDVIERALTLHFMDSALNLILVGRSGQDDDRSEHLPCRRARRLSLANSKLAGEIRGLAGPGKIAVIGILSSRGTVPESEALERGGPSRTLGWLSSAAGGKQIPTPQRISGDPPVGYGPGRPRN